MIGMSHIAARMKNYSEKVDAIVEGHLDNTAKKVLAEARDKAPKDTGELIRSGKAEMVGPKEARVVFTADHAVIVHEDMEARHRNGGPLFLDRAMKENTQASGKVLAAKIRSIK